MSASASKVCVEVDDQKIQDQLCSAFEGGSNYWYQIEEKVFAPGVAFKYWHLEAPLTEGCFLIIRAPTDASRTDDGEPDAVLEDDMVPAILDRRAIERGLQVMAEKYPRHFADVVNEDGDATTGDVFLQCCLYGELIFR